MNACLGMRSHGRKGWKIFENHYSLASGQSSVSTLFEGSTELYAKSNWTSSQGAVGLS